VVGEKNLKIENPLLWATTTSLLESRSPQNFPEGKGSSWKNWKIPNYKTEIMAMRPVIIKGDLTKIK